MTSLLFILWVKIIGMSVQLTFFIILNVRAEFKIDLFYCLKFPDRVYNKKGNRGLKIAKDGVIFIRKKTSLYSNKQVCLV
jgi:hypothetical protein